MQNYTNIEQSKKLAEILPIESADGTWKQYAICGDALNVPEEMQYIHQETPFKLYSGIGCPCWSLAALLGVLPNKIVSHETAFEGEDAKGINDIYYKCIKSTEDDHYICRYVGNGYKYECVADNPIDACYEMIIKLHEQNLI